MRRRLGQHFLADPAILNRIVDAIDPEPADTVIEIGPGRGTLTRRLAPRVGRVIAIEKDRELARALRERGSVNRETGNVKREAGAPVPDNVTVIEGDALALDWHRLLAESTLPASRFPLPGFKIMGNIPYSITTPLIEKALTPPLPRVLVYLVQREVADRLAAAPGSGSYGALSVGVQAAARIELLFAVRAGSFQPPPAVDSAAVRLTPLIEPLVVPERQRAFRRFVTALFSQRRKQLGKSLRWVAGLAREDAMATLEGAGVDPTLRPEVLSAQAFVRLFEQVER